MLSCLAKFFDNFRILTNFCPVVVPILLEETPWHVAVRREADLLAIVQLEILRRHGPWVGTWVDLIVVTLVAAGCSSLGTS